MLTSKTFNTIRSLSKLEIVEISLATLFILLLPLAPPSKTSWIIASMTTLSIYKILISKKSLKRLLDYRPIIFLFILNIWGLVFSEDIVKGIQNVEKSLSMIVMPIIFIGLYKNQYLFKIRFFPKVMVASVLITSVVYLVMALYHSIDFVNGHLTFNPYYRKITQNNDLILNHFYYSDLVAFSHTTYFALYLCFSILILFESVLKKGFRLTDSLYIAFLFVMVYLTSSKVGFIVAAIILFSFIFFQLRSKPLYILLIIVGLGCMSPILVAKNHRFKKLLETTIQNDKISFEKMPRFITWSHSLRVIKNNLWLGVGTGDSQIELINSYRTDNRVYGHQYKFNSHNQYLDYTIKFGFVGFLSIIYLGLYTLVKKYGGNNYLFRCFVLVVGFNFIFENMLSLFHGVAFISFFYCYFIAQYHSDTNEADYTKP